MYRYIIVGAGAAGCVLAYRLSQNPQNKVLLLEAGGPDVDLRITMPAAFSKLFKSRHDWAYFTEPQPHLNNRQLFWPRGKVLGGSSSINAMIYIRGNRQDYDDWAAAGLAGWDYNSLLPYFTKSEHNTRGASAFHGTHGPWHITDLQQPHILSKTFLQAAQQAGIAPNPDFAANTQLGAGLYQVNQKNGKRHSTAAAFLKPAMLRPNLTVLVRAHVTKVNVQGGVATSVTYLHKGATHTAAAQDIILTGGAVNSPQLLLLSGIGDRAHLADVNVPLVHHLPGVGQNLKDHLIIGALYKLKQPIALVGQETLANVLRYVFTRKGPLTSNVAEGGAFVKMYPHSDRPDIQFLFGPNYFRNHGFSNPPGHGFSVGPTLLYPKSTGSITLRSNNPLAQPVIQPNYFSHADDLQILVDAMRLARKIGEAPAFDPYRTEEIFPGPAVQTDADMAAFVRANAETLYHPVATCRMGNGTMDVVDQTFRVHGLKGLRVADASVLPSIIGGNTQAPTVMIAEKAADVIENS
jgi:choline dehydrogenase